MITASKLSGFFAAHAIWCVSDGDTLIPMIAYTTGSGERKMERMAHDDIEAAVAAGRDRLQSGELDADDAALIYDGRITLETGKFDAIIIEMQTEFSPQSKATIAVPYSPSTSGAFRVHKPKLLQWDDCDDFDMNWAIESFFEGVAEHAKGNEIWIRCLDESV